MIHEACIFSGKMAPKQIVFSEGRMSAVLRAVQVIRDEGIAKPILIGRRSEIERRIQSAGLRIREGMILKLFISEAVSSVTSITTSFGRLTTCLNRAERHICGDSSSRDSAPGDTLWFLDGASGIMQMV